MLTSNELPTEVVRSVPLKISDDGTLKKKKKKRGSFASDLKFAYQWNENEGHLMGFDTVSGTNFGEYSFGDGVKDNAAIEAVVEFENGTNLACCAVSYENRCLLCCVDLSLSKVMHSIKIKKYPLTTLKVIWHGSLFPSAAAKVHPILRNSGGLIAAGQIGGKVLLIDMQTNHANWWKHEEFNPTNLSMVGSESCGDPVVLQKAESLMQKGLHLAVVLDGGHNETLEVTCMQFCKEPNILIVGHNTGHFDIWSLMTLSRIYAGEPTGGKISHIMSMLPEDDPRKSIYIWIVENGRPEDSIVDDHNVCASANLHVVSYKSGGNVSNDYEKLESVNCVFRLLFDKVGDSNETDTYTTTCVSVSPISIDINNHYLSSLNCTGLCSFVWSEQNLSPRTNFKFYSAIFDLGRWYAEEMPKQALVSELEIVPKSYLAYAQLDTGRSELLEAKVCSSGTKKNIWELNEEVTSFAASTSFSMLLITNKNIQEIYFPGIQSFLFDKIDEMKPWELIEPHNLFTKCIVAGLMPEGMYSAKKIYPKVKMVEAIYEVAINHNLLAFMRRCASEFFDGKYENDGLSTQHLFEWAWNKAVEVKSKIDDLLNSMYSGQEMTQSDKNCHNQYVSDLKCIAKLFSHVEKEKLLHLEDSRRGLQQRIRGLSLVNDYLRCVQYFCTCRLIPNAASRGLRRLDLLKNEYTLRRQKDGELLVDLLVNRFGKELKDLWISLGGDGIYPPPSMHSILVIFLLDAAHIRDKHCLMLYFLNDITKASRMNESLAAGYKEMISSQECNEQVFTAQFLWSVDRGYLLDALKGMGNDKLDPSWTETIFAHLNLRSTSKDLYEVYRCIGLDTDTIDRKKFVISLFLDNGLVVPAFKWIRSTNAGVFDSTCFAFFLKRTHEVSGLDKLVAKELSLNPPELSMLYNYLKRHNLSGLVTQLEEKIGMSNFVPSEVEDGKIYDDVLDFKLPEVFTRNSGKPIESVEVLKFLKGSFTTMKQMFCTPLTNCILPEAYKPSILKTTDSPAASPMHMSPGMSPSLKRLRFQLPKQVDLSSISSSSNGSSPVVEDLTPFQFQSPHQASTPISTPATSLEPDSVFEFSNPSPVLHPRLESVKQLEGEAFFSPLSKSSLSTVSDVMEPDHNFVADIVEHNTSTPVDTGLTVAEKDNSLYFETDAPPERKEVLIEDEDSFEYETRTPLIQRVAPFVNTAQRKRKLTELAADILTVPAIVLSECEEDASMTEAESDKLSPQSASNESFFSICSDKTSPNSSIASFTSAMDVTITLPDDEDENGCPITKKRRSEMFEHTDLTPTKPDGDESDDLIDQDFSPSKFWQPPALAPMDLAPGPSACDSIDYSSLPKPPQRPSPRKSIRRSPFDEDQAPVSLSFVPLTPEKLSTPETQEKPSIPETSEETDTHISQNISTATELEPEMVADINVKQEVTAEIVSESVAKKDNLYDSVFHRTVDLTLERDLLELEAEHNAKPAEDLAEVDHEFDVTLNKTVILVSSDGSIESPTKISKMMEPVSPDIDTNSSKSSQSCFSPSKIVDSLDTLEETTEIKTERESLTPMEVDEEIEAPLEEAEENVQSEIEPKIEDVPFEMDSIQTTPVAPVESVVPEKPIEESMEPVPQETAELPDRSATIEESAPEDTPNLEQTLPLEPPRTRRRPLSSRQTAKKATEPVPQETAQPEDELAEIEENPAPEVTLKREETPSLESPRKQGRPQTVRQPAKKEAESAPQESVQPIDKPSEIEEEVVPEDTLKREQTPPLESPRPRRRLPSSRQAGKKATEPAPQETAQPLDKPAEIEEEVVPEDTRKREQTPSLESPRKRGRPQTLRQPAKKEAESAPQESVQPIDEPSEIEEEVVPEDTLKREQTPPLESPRPRRRLPSSRQAGKKATEPAPQETAQPLDEPAEIEEEVVPEDTRKREQTPSLESPRKRGRPQTLRQPAKKEAESAPQESVQPIDEPSEIEEEVVPEDTLKREQTPPLESPRPRRRLPSSRQAGKKATEPAPQETVRPLDEPAEIEEEVVPEDTRKREQTPSLESPRKRGRPQTLRQPAKKEAETVPQETAQPIDELAEIKEEVVPEDTLNREQTPPLESPRPRRRLPSSRQAGKKATEPAPQESAQPLDELAAIEEETAPEETTNKESPRSRGRPPGPRQPAKVKESAKETPALRSKALGLTLEAQLDDLLQTEEGKKLMDMPKTKVAKKELQPEKTKKMVMEKKKTVPKPEKETAMKSKEKPAPKPVKSKPAPKSVKGKREEEKAQVGPTAPEVVASTSKPASAVVKKEAKPPTKTTAAKKKVEKVEAKPEPPVITRRNLRSASQEPRSLPEVATPQKSPVKSRAKKTQPETSLPEKQPKSMPRKKKEENSPEASSREPMATSPRRVRSRKAVAELSEPLSATVRTRRRSRSASIEPASESIKTRNRSASVSSDSSFASQASTMSRKRKADTESEDESTASESGPRRSARKRMALQNKRAPKVSIIPEENA
ncbi:titin-like isoform X2 [Cloeon dipterum]|uniref:titin-like isoform X2 n=1 Tax=Cloeon dipterum TaxID=197152 RepID=UPI0032206B5D